MNGLIPFMFDGHQVRTVQSDAGLLVVAKDVAEALGYSWQPNLIGHVPEEWRGVNPINTPGGVQQMAVLTEQGLYFFLGRSDKPGALPMQKWVSGEVLPSIRKTGGYATPTKSERASKVSIVITKALLMIGKAVSGVRGVKPEVAMSLTLDAIEKETGLPASSMRLALPGAAVSEAEKLNPTQLGERLGGKKARAVNVALSALGLQKKDAREGWVLTEAGAKHGQMVPFTKHGHSGYQPLWHESVIGPLQEYFAAGGCDNVVPIGA